MWLINLKELAFTAISTNDICTKVKGQIVRIVSRVSLFRAALKADEFHSNTGFDDLKWNNQALIQIKLSYIFFTVYGKKQQLQKVYLFRLHCTFFLFFFFLYTVWHSLSRYACKASKNVSKKWSLLQMSLLKNSMFHFSTGQRNYETYDWIKANLKHDTTKHLKNNITLCLGSGRRWVRPSLYCFSFHQ